MKQGTGNRRVNEQARETIARILLFEVNDPRLSLVTITGCEVSYDRSVARVFFSCAPDEYDQVKAALEQAKGRIRSCMARELSWRVAPELRFEVDRSVDEAAKIARALSGEAEHFQANPVRFDEGEYRSDEAGDEVVASEAPKDSAGSASPSDAADSEDPEREGGR